MTRDETVRERTVERFLECEAIRAEGRAAALAKGKSEDVAHYMAHGAAKAHWNAWAEAMLAKRKALVVSGAWAAEKYGPGNFAPRSTETGAWIEEAETSFSRCLFLLESGGRTEESPGERKSELEGGSVPVKSIVIDGPILDFRDFIFPSHASFDDAIFNGKTSFSGATIKGNASFLRVTFTGDASFDTATIKGNASFDNATFEGDA